MYSIYAYIHKKITQRLFCQNELISTVLWCYWVLISMDYIMPSPEVVTGRCKPSSLLPSLSLPPSFHLSLPSSFHLSLPPSISPSLPSTSTCVSLFFSLCFSEPRDFGCGSSVRQETAFCKGIQLLPLMISLERWSETCFSQDSLWLTKAPEFTILFNWDLFVISSPSLEALGLVTLGQAAGRLWFVTACCIKRVYIFGVTPRSRYYIYIYVWHFVYITRRTIGSQL